MTKNVEAPRLQVEALSASSRLVDELGVQAKAFLSSAQAATNQRPACSGTSAKLTGMSQAPTECMYFAIIVQEASGLLMALCDSNFRQVVA